MIKYYLEEREWFDLARGTKHSAAWDVICRASIARTIDPGERFLMNTGLFLAMEPGICAQVCSRSGLAINHGVVVLNAPGIIDPDYRGEVKISLINLGRSAHVIHPGDKIAQLLFVPVFPECYTEHDGGMLDFTPKRVYDRDELGFTVRGAGGHGSTGR